MARLHVQTRAAGRCDSHRRVIDSHDLRHADDTNHAGYQQLTIKNIKHLKEKREMMIKLVNPDRDAATTCRIYESRDGEIILSIEYETIDSISFVGLSEPMSVEAAITAIKNNALAEIKTSGEEGEIHNLPMKRFVGHTEIEEDGPLIRLYFPNMSEKTREKFVEAFND